ncbi:hypothetical protein DBR47_22040 [Paucibacter sp. KBW04]|uniref:PEP-CTERM sorting domain-containing protein n=1 Tax=Paucibacter sp. KBW04 TaxID=2153361 RepID=UPI000F563AFB|nr:PEP-CTERM sorting domain-containing protein [Paucibacter sp. KBW04]RQO54751.1 hypothetical protein DBR47_22040 [Paucibacter sp. KBW04]
MKLSRVAMLACVCLTPTLATSAFAATPNWTVNFEHPWDYANGGVASFYNGGAADDGSSGGANLGVEFIGVSGLSNDADFTYYAGAPSPQGVAYVYGSSAFMNVAGGVDKGLALFYASASDVQGAIKVYSGLNGTGDLLGSFDLSANSSAAYEHWSKFTLSFAGIAKSFDLSGSVGTVAFDNISAVPEPSTLVLMLAGVAALTGWRRRSDGFV